MKIDRETIKKIAIGAGKILVYGSLTLLGMKLNNEAKHVYYDEYVDCDDCNDYGYNDAIDAIINSDMSSCYKDSAIRRVKPHMTKEYYKAVASIAKGNDSDCYKVSMIRKLYDGEAQA